MEIRYIYFKSRNIGFKWKKQIDLNGTSKISFDAEKNHVYK